MICLMNKMPPFSFRKILPRILNLFLWLCFCTMAGTGFLLAFRMPPGSRGGRGLEAFGLGRHDWGNIHTWIGYAFLLTIVLHLALHWRWLWQIAARRRAWPMIAGFGLGIILLLFLIFQPVHGRDERGHQPAQKHSNNPEQ